MKKKVQKLEYYDTKRYRIFIDILEIIGLLISIVSLYVAFLVRKDTAELSKFSDKPIYYSINLYPNDKTSQSVVSDKYLSIDLTLIVDDFEINKKNFLDVNYNAVFTKTKYYMVYDYDIDNKNYKYMKYALDDKTEGKMRFEDNYYVAPVKLNYSITPNKKYCYILIYTETTSQKNLDLIFFNYYDNPDTFKLDTILDDDGKEKIDIMRIDNDTNICKDHFIDLWSNSDSSSASDLEFMFDVYNDLKDKLSDTL